MNKKFMLQAVKNGRILYFTGDKKMYYKLEGEVLMYSEDLENWKVSKSEIIRMLDIYEHNFIVIREMEEED